MSSAAQQNANIANAQNSTGPKTAEGKSRAAQNAVKTGLFSKRDFVPPESREAYDEFRQSLLQQLAPANPLESTLANEIVSASWRLERIAQNEANSEIDPVADEALPFERARTAASRILFRSINELRKIQTDRIARLFTLTEEATDEIADIAAAHRAVGIARAAKSGKFAPPSGPIGEYQSYEELERTWEPLGLDPAVYLEALARRQNEPNRQPETHSETPRNAPCPCGSGAKYKRCCGISAPGRVTSVASKAA